MVAISALTASAPACNSKLAQSRSKVCHRRNSVRVCAEGDNANANARKKIDFQPNTRSGVGYIADDSAGQTNIFAVEPKRYVAGSQEDNTGSSNIAIGIGAAVLGGIILLAGVIGGKGGVSSSTPADEGLLSLTEYSQQFSREQ